VVKNGSNYEYQYAIADHQGNTRVMFSAVAPTPTEYLGTYEQPHNYGFNVDTTKYVPFNSANHTPGGKKVFRINQNNSIGPAKSIKVYPGDKVDMEVWSYHENASGFGTSTPSSGAMITAVAAAFGGVSGAGGESGMIFDGVNSSIAGGFAFGGNAGNTSPAAYLNYIQFDQNYKVLNFGYKRVKATTYTKDSVKFAQLSIKEPGYVFVYLSYEDLSNNYV